MSTTKLSKPNPETAKRTKSSDKTLAAFESLSKLSHYDPYKVFDSRRGCIVAVALCILLIVVFVLNIALNGAWISLPFILLYGLIIRNRLRKLRNMETQAEVRKK